jgi:hypothetical protein
MQLQKKVSSFMDKKAHKLQLKAVFSPKLNTKQVAIFLIATSVYCTGTQR